MRSKPLWVVGSGGHAKVVIETARASGEYEVVGILDDRTELRGVSVLSVPIRGTASRESAARLGVEHAVIAVGHNGARERVAGRFDGLVVWATLVHPAAHLSSSARLGEGTVVFAGAVVQPDAVVGRHVILNTACSVDHDCEVGDFAHLAPGVRLGGEVRVGRGALLGIASCALPRRAVGDWATVGGGGVVVHDVPAGATAVGAPARILHHAAGEPGDAPSTGVRTGTGPRSRLTRDKRGGEEKEMKGGGRQGKR